MTQLSLNEARELLFSSDAKYVFQELSSIYYDNFSGELAIEPYMTCGCLAVKGDAIWHIHAISTESDLFSAIDEVKGLMDPDTEKLMVLTWNKVPEELADKRGAYKFARGYLPYSDQSVRRLTLEDDEQIRACCAYDPEDNQIGQSMANDFFAHYKDFLHDADAINLGLFVENRLVGFAQAIEQKGLGFSTVNIYVNRTQRKKGYAKRLLSALCASSENMTYCYSCVKTNLASMNTAKSCGFQFKGAYLMI